VPWSPPPFDLLASPLRLRTLANVTGADEQRLWHYTLDCMEQQPHANLAELRRVRSWITHGVTLDLRSQPSAIDHSNTYSVQVEAEAVRKRIVEYIAFEALIPLPDDHPCPYGVQPLHVIIRPDRKPRLVVDLSRNLNDHLAYEYFSYTTVSQAVERATPGCWFSKLDLSNCFLSFPLHPSALPYFIFRFDGRLYQFTRMPFGLSSAPRICTALLAVPAFAMRMWGVDRSDRYLDDTLLTDDSRPSAARSLLVAQHVISRFGLVINPDKTVGPAQQLPFLGILLDSVHQTLSCTPERLAELRALLSQAASVARIPIPQLQSLIGKLQFVTSVLPGARPFLHRMIQLMNDRTRAVKQQHLERRTGTNPAVGGNAGARLARAGINPAVGGNAGTCNACPGNSPIRELSRRRLHFATVRATVRVDRIMRDDLAFWQSHLSLWDGRQRWRSAYSDPYTFASDASLKGFGFYLESAPSSAHTADEWPRYLRVGSGFCGIWSASDAHLHTCSGQMTWCEMFAVLAALFTYRTALRNSSVLFYLDNEPDVYTLNRQATRSARLAGLLRGIYTIAVDYNISIRAEHRPGVDNVLADFLSRTELRDAAEIVDAWRASEHSASLPLLFVSFIHSHRVGGRQSRPSSTTSAATA
jgi:hypothetical protein